MKLTPQEVFVRLLEIMHADNGFVFEYTDTHEDDALPAIMSLQAAGYFQDSPYDLDGSFWMAGAGEYSEAPEFFRLDEKGFDQLSSVLNRIFNGEP